MKTKQKRSCLLLMACLSLFPLFPFVEGCSSGHSLNPTLAPANAVASGSTSALGMSGLGPEAVRIGVIQDKSASSGPNLTEQANEEQIAGLINILRKTGGEMAYAVIGNGSDRPLIRLQIDTPPQTPRTVENPFENQIALANYEKQYSAWNKVASGRIAGFQSAIRPLVQEPATGEKSPVWQMIHEMDIFLGEPDAGRPARQYLIVISDGIDTAGGRPSTLASNATVLIINGSGVPRPMQILDPINLESVGAAARFIAKKEGIRHAY